MIGKKTLKDYDFKTIESYFNYIEESLINGNFSQVKDLFNKLSIFQRKLCLNYFNCEERKETLNYIINQI